LDTPLVPGPFPGVPGPAGKDRLTGQRFNGRRGPELDRFIMSPSQYAVVLYAALVEVGRMVPEGLAQFNVDGGSVEMIGADHSPGLELMSGSLGQGLSQAAGIALARRRRGEAGRVWVFMSDGEFQSGQTWETIQTASHLGLDNLGVYVDVNGHQCDGRMLDVMNVEPLDARLKAFGAQVARVDGHDPLKLAAPARRRRDGRPLFVLCQTDTCRGVEPLRARAPKFHYLRFRDDAERQQYAALLERMR
jgi:transketolase